MDLKKNGSSPVLTDPAPLNNSRLGLPPNIKPYSSAAQAYSSGLYSTKPRRKAILGKLDDVRANSWLDAMKSSSPPRKQLNKDLISEPAIDENDMAYQTWLMREAVKRASEYFPTAIISGRSREKGKKVHLFQPASEFLPMINEVWPEVAQRVVNLLKDYPQIRPVIDWNKGKAVEFLLESLGLSNREDVLSIYVGDDRTDEDAFEVMEFLKSLVRLKKLDDRCINMQP
ncbi:hypothetical protein B296_00008949 [Ensete ventricosum]|uniref:Trehalose 6-phosphate phosphatase n=1 Tax=Ensete ventricosum TaxID=4639 RepID=A0A427AHC1_ENSVE|nr:hypothetical protein B296_00008949 [Ensete ventricosum]